MNLRKDHSHHVLIVCNPIGRVACCAFLVTVFLLVEVPNDILCSGECLGSRIREGRSELRYALRIAKFRESIVC